MQTDNQFEVFLKRLDTEIMDLRESLRMDPDQDIWTMPHIQMGVDICNSILNAIGEAQEGNKPHGEGLLDEQARKKSLLNHLKWIEDRIERDQFWNAISLVQTKLMPELLSHFNDALKGRK